VKIIVDAMGGDNAPDEIVKGAILAAEEFGVDIILTGRGEAILHSLENIGKRELPRGVEIANATEVVTMEDDPATATRSKPDSSMTVGLKMLRDGAAEAMVSAGSTGALFAGATLIIKRVRGIRRAAMAPFIPNAENGVLLIDCGANVECTPEYLLQFAFMGSFYMKNVIGIEKPRVGLLNIGAESSKGGDLQKETYALLQRADSDGRICFAGNAEARDVMLGGFDVVVSDGFTGNVLLKGIEGMGLFMFSELKKVFLKSSKSKLAAAMVKKDFSALKKKLDASEVGGTALLGISKPVIKAHGSSDAYAIRSAIRQAIESAKADVAVDLSKNIAFMRIDTEEASPTAE